MDNLISEAQKDIYRLKDMMQIEMLRAYKTQCLREDIAKGLDRMEIEMNDMGGIINDLPKMSNVEPS